MSQRTRARTTGDATTRRSKAAPKAEPAQTTQALHTSQHVSQAAQPGDRDRAGQASPATEQQVAPAESAFAPETLARTLRAVAAELERDPELARRVARAAGEPRAPSPAVLSSSSTMDAAIDAPEQQEAKGKRAARTFRPRLVTGMSPDLGQGVVDPFALYASRGEDGLRAALNELRLGSLRAIIREHGVDPSGKLAQQNDAEKLRGAILTAAKKRR